METRLEGRLRHSPFPLYSKRKKAETLTPDLSLPPLGPT